LGYQRNLPGIKDTVKDGVKWSDISERQKDFSLLAFSFTGRRGCGTEIAINAPK